MAAASEYPDGLRATRWRWRPGGIRSRRGALVRKAKRLNIGPETLHNCCQGGDRETLATGECHGFVATLLVGNGCASGDGEAGSVNQERVLEAAAVRRRAGRGV
jgi:hypothetical protein